MTYEQLSVLKGDGDKHEGLCSQIYLDEAQAIRRCRETERGRLLMALKVPGYLYSVSLLRPSSAVSTNDIPATNAKGAKQVAVLWHLDPRRSW
jgi:hypothetical protein